MKDEIKEILSLLKSSSWCNEANQIEDYITNLQEENKKNKEYSEFYKDMSDKWKNMSDVFKKSCEDYKSRNERATEYMQENSLSNFDKELYYILTGGDE